jgi:hypothetical protein
MAQRAGRFILRRWRLSVNEWIGFAQSIALDRRKNIGADELLAVRSRKRYALLPSEPSRLSPIARRLLCSGTCPFGVSLSTSVGSNSANEDFA